MQLQIVGSNSPKTKQNGKDIPSAYALFLRGLAAEIGRKTGKALQFYKQALELNSSLASAHVNIGIIEYNNQRPDVAEYHFKRAIGLDKKYALGYFNLAKFLHIYSRRDEAISYYKAALQCKPLYAEAHYNLALVYKETRQISLAVHHLNLYLHYNTDEPFWEKSAQKLLTSLNNVIANQPTKPFTQENSFSRGIHLVKKKS